MNSSSLEIASGLASWCGLLGLAQRDDAPPRLVGWTAFALALFVLSRPSRPARIATRAAVISTYNGESPMAVGTPVLAASLIPESQQRAFAASRAPTLVAAIVAAAHFTTFLWILHRYTSGLHGSWLPVTIRWEPPIPVSSLVALTAVGYLALAWLIRRVTSEVDPDRPDADQRETRTVVVA